MSDYPDNMLPTLSDDANTVRQEILRDLASWQNEEGSNSHIEHFFQKSDGYLIARIEEITRTMPPMNSRIRAVICMPVVAFGEQDSRSLGRTLKRLSQASIEGPETEVLVLCNWPKGRYCDSAPDVALRIARESTSLKIIIVPAELDSHEQSAGYYRALMHGITLLRTLKRGIANEVIHITMDSDTVRIPVGYVQAYIDTLNAHSVFDAVIGQLDWDNETIPTARIPELFFGNELMRLLPKHSTWRILSRPAFYDNALIQECVFSRRSFGRGVQANIAWKGSIYARVGGYRPEPHDELDYILRKILVTGHMQNVAFLWNEVGICSDSRRALWALKNLGMPPMRQWSVAFQADDPIRRSLPDMAEHVEGVTTKAIEQQINLTLEAFNMPREPLQAAVIAALAEMGFGYNDYDLVIRTYAPDPLLAVAQIRISDDCMLKSRLIS